MASRGSPFFARAMFVLVFMALVVCTIFPHGVGAKPNSLRGLEESGPVTMGESSDVTSEVNDADKVGAPDWAGAQQSYVSNHAGDAGPSTVPTLGEANEGMSLSPGVDTGGLTFGAPMVGGP